MARPMFVPTAEQRALVKSLAGVGIHHEEIARKIGIRSPKTLRRHFREELDTGATDANYKVAKTLFEMATSGDCPAATIFWAKTRNGYREHPYSAGAPMTPPPFIVAREPEGSQP